MHQRSMLTGLLLASCFSAMAQRVPGLNGYRLATWPAVASTAAPHGAQLPQGRHLLLNQYTAGPGGAASAAPGLAMLPAARRAGASQPLSPGLGMLTEVLVYTFLPYRPAYYSYQNPVLAPAVTPFRLSTQL